MNRLPPLMSLTLRIIVSLSMALAGKNAQIERKIVSYLYKILQSITLWK